MKIQLFKQLNLFAIGALGLSVVAIADDTRTAVLNTYADIAAAGYADSHNTAKNMQQAIKMFLNTPNPDTMETARQAWRDARVPYMQTEVYRFGNTIVDDWEGKVNAWPLDEGLIDYVDASQYGTDSDENSFYAANVIANPKLTFSGAMIDATNITPTLLSEHLQEADGNEANVATGYHAVEFLLWGQDLNGNGIGAGDRPATDFDLENCSNGNCDRRIAYLETVTSLLIDDLAWMVTQWTDGGSARENLMADPKKGLSAILTGMGSLSYGELAGERMKLGLILHDPEEEHDCFADNTHFSHYYDAKGIQNVFLGAYTRTDGSIISGPGIVTLLKQNAPDIGNELDAKLTTTMSAMRSIVDTAKAGEAYDQMIGEGNNSGNAIVQAAIEALVAQTKVIDKAVTALGLNNIDFEGSDSLDSPEKVES